MRHPSYIHSHYSHSHSHSLTFTLTLTLTLTLTRSLTRSRSHSRSHTHAHIHTLTSYFLLPPSLLPLLLFFYGHCTRTPGIQLHLSIGQPGGSRSTLLGWLWHTLTLTLTLTHSLTLTFTPLHLTSYYPHPPSLDQNCRLRPHPHHQALLV